MVASCHYPWRVSRQQHNWWADLNWTANVHVVVSGRKWECAGNDGEFNWYCRYQSPIFNSYKIINKKTKKFNNIEKKILSSRFVTIVCLSATSSSKWGKNDSSLVENYWISEFIISNNAPFLWHQISMINKLVSNGYGAYPNLFLWA